MRFETDRRRVAALSWPFHTVEDGKLVKLGEPHRVNFRLRFEGVGEIPLYQLVVELPGGGWYHLAHDMEFSTEAEALEYVSRQ